MENWQTILNNYNNNVFQLDGLLKKKTKTTTKSEAISGIYSCVTIADHAIIMIVLCFGAENN